MFYYVAMHNADSHTLLAGPYEREAEAIAAKEPAHSKACERDGYNWFHLVSLGRSEERMQTMFGRI